jgi:predicted nucleotidyltransferase
MRLSEEQRRVVKEATAACFEPSATVCLFGSRVDDNKKGGDIDLLVETSLSDPEMIAAAHIRFVSRLYREMGEQKIDLLIDYPGRRQQLPIFEIARAQGIRL